MILNKKKFSKLNGSSWIVCWFLWLDDWLIDFKTNIEYILTKSEEDNK